MPSDDAGDPVRADLFLEQQQSRGRHQKQRSARRDREGHVPGHAVRQRQPGERLPEQAARAHQRAEPDLAAVRPQPAAPERGDREHERAEIPVEEVLRLIRVARPRSLRIFSPNGPMPLATKAISISRSQTPASRVRPSPTRLGRPAAASRWRLLVLPQQEHRDRNQRERERLAGLTARRRSGSTPPSEYPPRG